ncbi:Per1-like protein [Saitoella complicata NRRL Y-17804]|uniref:Per1-like protein n=1 Tax=Saitoella complicata (strain BCRC 22490 / CBS 7301 / JCM 7358 / NBRC 10748 / NRRL Y-17804) TaxID=698492 RepID=UPI0008671661|nr:Per1-like protein [Saitoella complicata NRRL Y-17804]ODQ51581.1 Per1-like protein [Saitoella complicata NRRL Y-17804]
MSVTRRNALLATAAVVSCAATVVYASRGDRLPAFQYCLQKCTDNLCNPSSGTTYLPIHLRLLGWTCESNCDYLCQRALTAEHVASNHVIEQYHGKWPFLRIFGMQEPLSVLFSVLNGYEHWRGFRRLRARIPDRYVMKPFYLISSIVGMWAWLCSSIFHTRDYIITERADYFAAGLTMMYTLFYVPIRIFHLYRHPKSKTIVTSWGLICLTAYLAHVSYLSFVTFDYSYNMLANVLVGFASNLLWIYYSLTHYSSRPAWALWPAAIVVAVGCAMSLELFDFPPVWDLLDAHALWHASTVVLVRAFYAFLERDAEWESREEMKGEVGRR